MLFTKIKFSQKIEFTVIVVSYIKDGVHDKVSICNLLLSNKVLSDEASRLVWSRDDISETKI